MSGCSCLPLLPRDSHPLTRLHACGAVFWGDGRETLYSTESIELNIWKEGHVSYACLGAAGMKALEGRELRTN